MCRAPIVARSVLSHPRAEWRRWHGRRAPTSWAALRHGLRWFRGGLNGTVNILRLAQWMRGVGAVVCPRAAYEQPHPSGSRRRCAGRGGAGEGRIGRWRRLSDDIAKVLPSPSSGRPCRGERSRGCFSGPERAVTIAEKWWYRCSLGLKSSGLATLDWADREVMVCTSRTAWGRL